MPSCLYLIHIVFCIFQSQPLPTCIYVAHIDLYIPNWSMSEKSLIQISSFPISTKQLAS
jgi:hypothetical protein